MRGDLPRHPARRRGAAVPLAAQKRGLPRTARSERHSADGRHGGDLRRRGAGQALRPRAGRADAPPPFGTPTHGRFGRDAAHRRPHAHLLGRKRRLVPAPLGGGDRLLPRHLRPLRQGGVLRHSGVDRLRRHREDQRLVLQRHGTARSRKFTSNWKNFCNNETHTAYPHLFAFRTRGLGRRGHVAPKPDFAAHRRHARQRFPAHGRRHLFDQQGFDERRRGAVRRRLHGRADLGRRTAADQPPLRLRRHTVAFERRARLPDPRILGHVARPRAAQREAAT